MPGGNRWSHVCALVHLFCSHLGLLDGSTLSPFRIITGGRCGGRVVDDNEDGVGDPGGTMFLVADADSNASDISFSSDLEGALIACISARFGYDMDPVFVSDDGFGVNGI